MPDTSTPNTTCQSCGKPYYEGPSERVPCPHCGTYTPRYIERGCADAPVTRDSVTKSVVHERSCAHTLVVKESVSLSLRPTAQARDWRRRWTEIQAHLVRLRAPHTEPLSGETIQTANHDLQSFFVQAYHLKDSLKQDASALGIAASDVEDAITNTPVLALLADLANMDKHGKLDRTPRSGDIPDCSVSGETDPAGGWRLKLAIRHNRTTHDGLTVASNSVTAWEKHLRAWKLG